MPGIHDIPPSTVFVFGGEIYMKKVPTMFGNVIDLQTGIEYTMTDPGQVTHDMNNPLEVEADEIALVPNQYKEIEHDGRVQGY